VRRVPAPDPWAKTLGLEPGDRLVIRNSPDGAASTPVPAAHHRAITTSLRGRGRFEVALGFATSLDDVERLLAELAPRLVTDGALWISWPIRSARPDCDCSVESIEGRADAIGLIPTKYGPIQPGWTGIRFVRQVRTRPRPADRARDEAR